MSINDLYGGIIDYYRNNSPNYNYNSISCNGLGFHCYLLHLVIQKELLVNFFFEKTIATGCSHK